MGKKLRGTLDFITYPFEKLGEKTMNKITKTREDREIRSEMMGKLGNKDIVDLIMALRKMGYTDEINDPDDLTEAVEKVEAWQKAQEKTGELLERNQKIHEHLKKQLGKGALGSAGAKATDALRTVRIVTHPEQIKLWLRGAAYATVGSTFLLMLVNTCAETCKKEIRDLPENLSMTERYHGFNWEKAVGAFEVASKQYLEQAAEAKKKIAAKTDTSKATLDAAAFWEQCGAILANIVQQGKKGNQQLIFDLEKLILLPKENPGVHLFNNKEFETKARNGDFMLLGGQTPVTKDSTASQTSDSDRTKTDPKEKKEGYNRSKAIAAISQAINQYRTAGNNPNAQALSDYLQQNMGNDEALKGILSPSKLNEGIHRFSAGLAEQRVQGFTVPQ